MVVTRRRVLQAAGSLIAVAALPEAVMSQSATAGFKSTITTLFWVGEPPNSENANIPNHESYWDQDWKAHYGGIDDPKHRKGYWPAKFRPRENPFYVALPYGEFTDANKLKRGAKNVPWYRPGLSPLLKNRWVEIRRGDGLCFAQWEDVGPCGENDFDYVFGTAPRPLNTFDAKAGLDVSPAVWHYLGMRDNSLAGWRLIEAADVPDGPWTEIVTTSGNNR